MLNSIDLIIIFRKDRLTPCINFNEQYGPSIRKHIFQMLGLAMRISIAKVIHHFIDVFEKVFSSKHSSQ